MGGVTGVGVAGVMGGVESGPQLPDGQIGMLGVGSEPTCVQLPFSSGACKGGQTHVPSEHAYEHA